ncbi:protein translocase subunit secE/sec61 gamma [Thiogranum longum]|uniref:Protein translocase subunit SecE n=2 Tax=Thiogranum longum TaxID=1537524 RepID=A0A4R1H7S4_9GAMM|nr:protein translocase subunit secE/sec61 gamma [Thiogranum longum]
MLFRYQSRYMSTEIQAGGADTAKLTAAAALLVGGVAAFYWFADQSLLMRVLGLLAVVGVSIFIAAQTALGHSIIAFLGDTRTEVRKVVWPTRAETTQTVMAVIFVVILMGVLLWMLDMFLLWAIRILTGQGG